MLDVITNGIMQKIAVHLAFTESILHKYISAGTTIKPPTCTKKARNKTSYYSYNCQFKKHKKHPNFRMLFIFFFIQFFENFQIFYSS